MPIINFTKIPLVSPLKWVRNTASPVWGMDESWFTEQIKSWERRVYYAQKWKFGMSTPQQIWSTVAPSPMKLYRCSGGDSIKDIIWTQTGTSDVGNVYEVVVNLDTDGMGDPLPAGVYYLYFECVLLGYSCKFITEPISVRTKHPDTNIFTYTHSVNDFDLFPSLLSAPMQVLLEADMIDFKPGREVQDYTNQLHNITLLNAMPYREYTLATARAAGNPDYVVDMLNRVLCCDTWRFNGTQFTTTNGAKWEPLRSKGYPMGGWSIDVAPAINQTSLEHNQDGPVAPGLVTAYDITNDLFGGTGTPVPITDYQQS